MNNIIMILQLVAALNDYGHNNVVTTEISAKSVTTNISEGMSKEAVLAALGKPYRTAKVHNYYSDEDSTQLFFMGEPCLFASHDCSVELKENKVASIRDVKLTE